MKVSLIVDLAGNLQSRARQYAQALTGLSNSGSRAFSGLRNAAASVGRGLDGMGNRYTAMIAGAQRLAYSRGPEKYSFSVPSEKHRHLHTVDRTDAVALLMQAGSLALGEMDALRECKAKTAAANLYRAMIGF